MAVITRQKLEYYYDSHPTEEDLMGHTPIHVAVVEHAAQVLKRLARSQVWYIGEDLNIYNTGEYHEYPVAPDIAVFKDVQMPEELKDYPRSWSLKEPGRQPPVFVMEVASDETFQNDILVDRKPSKFARLGVREYVSWDPRYPDDPPGDRLRAWDCRSGVPVPVPLDWRGWLWSEELESWLVPEGSHLQFNDRFGNRRLTGEEAEKAEKERALAAERAERAEKERALAAERAERAEKERALAAERVERAEKERALAAERAERAEKERALAAEQRLLQELEELRKRLRSSGDDPKVD